MSGPGSVGPPQGSLPPPPYPGFSPSHSPASAPGSVGAPHPPQSPQFYPPKPSPSSGSSLLASQLHQPPTNPHLSLNTDQDEKQRLRFQIELEFVQNLGNPNYLNFLAQRGFFKDPTFVNYLKYLQYWKEPQYVKFLKYPVCLHFLEMLQHEAFRKEIVNGLCAKFIDDQTILQWQHYSRKRAKLVENASASNAATVSNTPASNAGGVGATAPPSGAASVKSEKN